MSGRAYAWGVVASVLIVGAGPAGSVAAAILARGGAEVTLVESARFPRDKVCGECVSDLGWQTLDAHGLHIPIDALSPVLLRRGALVGGDGTRLDVSLPKPMRGVTRRAMDAALLAVARKAGARVVQPARAERLQPGGRPSAMLRCLVTNDLRPWAGDLILVADGRSGLPVGGRPKPTGDLGAKAHFDGVALPADAISLFGFDGFYAGLAPVSDGQRVRWNLAMGVPARRVREHGGDFDGLLGTMRATNHAFDAAVRAATRSEAGWLACPLPRFAVRRDWPAGIVPLGNAVAALEPVGGEGMGLAIKSAALLAERLLAGPLNTVELRRDFEALWGVRRAACRAAAVLLSRPGVASWALGTAAIAPPVAWLGLRLVGK